MNEENLTTLVSFIVDFGLQDKLPNQFLYTTDDVYWIKHDKECVNEIVNIACALNQRILCEKISETIEEISDFWEVPR
jgi:hypothetical protein